MSRPLLPPPPHAEKNFHLAGRHGLGYESLESQLLLLEVVGGRVLNLELSHGVAHGSLDLLLGTTLDLVAQGWVGNDLLNAGDVGLELLSGLELLAESVIAGLELLGIYSMFSKLS